MHYCHNWKQVVQSWCFRELFIYFLNQSIHPFISLCLSAVGSWGQQPLTRFIRESPAALETQFAYPWSCCCSQYPKLMTVGERRNVDRELRLWLSSLPQHTGTASASLQMLHWSTCRSPAPSFPICELNSEILQILHLGQDVLHFSGWRPWWWRPWLNNYSTLAMLQTLLWWGMWWCFYIARSGLTWIIGIYYVPIINI